MTRQEAFKILGISTSSSQDEIKKAYRVLASKHHPDKNNGSKESEAKMKSINEAYTFLTSTPSSSQNMNNDWSRSPFEDIFSDFFKHTHGSHKYRDDYDSWYDPFANRSSNRQKNAEDFVKTTEYICPDSVNVTLEQIYASKSFIDVIFNVKNVNTYFGGRKDVTDEKTCAKLTPREILNGSFDFRDKTININIIKNDNININMNGDVIFNIKINFIDAYVGTTYTLSLPDARVISIKIPPLTCTNTKMKLPIHGIFAYAKSYVNVLVDILKTDDEDFLKIMDLLKETSTYKENTEEYKI